MLTNSIVAGNKAPTERDISGIVIRREVNIVGDSLSGAGASPAVDLEEIFEVDGDGTPVLADNGGLVETVAIREAGPATDANENFPNGIVRDARGEGREFRASDIGALELQEELPEVTGLTRIFISEDETETLNRPLRITDQGIPLLIEDPGVPQGVDVGTLTPTPFGFSFTLDGDAVADLEGGEFISADYLLTTTDGTEVTIEILVLGVGDGDGLDNTLTGSLLEDTIEGLGGNDILSGLGRDDLLDGGEGDDWLLAGTGADTFIGGIGDDTVDYSASGEGISASIVRGITSGNAENRDTLDGIENLVGSTGDDRLVGDDGANTLIGGGGSDTLLGLGGNDLLQGGSQARGGAGDDTIEGSDAADILVGGLGADTLTGGLGKDFLVGGAGPDRFVFAESRFGVDTIRDLEAGDVIDLTAFEIGLGDLEISPIHGGASSVVKFSEGAIRVIDVAPGDLDPSFFEF